MKTYEILAIEITDVNIKTKSLSIALIRRVTDSETGESEIQRHRQGFVPGEIEKVKEFIELNSGPEIDYINSLWTEEVINKYQWMLEQNEGF